MNLSGIVDWACDKAKFNNVEDYANFSCSYLEFAYQGLQAVIVSQNEHHYNFFQYKHDGNFNVTRPINTTLMFTIEQFEKEKESFIYTLSHIHDIAKKREERQNINRFIYTCQQSIGAALDALPSGKSNAARKLNGDLFERFIRIIISDIGIPVRQGIINVPVIVQNQELFTMSYQHDLIIEDNGVLVAIGSVKTSSKDRLDKIFIDKFLHNRLTSDATPHFAVFLNDVQRKGTEQNYGINSTFLTGHFKGYTIKLNPLDGVYYCDMRPIMKTDSILKKHIKPLDKLLVEDIWEF
jgi:hypothetical protein